MLTSNLFMQRLHDLRKSCDYEILFNLTSHGSTTNNTASTSFGSTMNSAVSTSHESTMNSAVSTSYWAVMAARSQGRCDKSSTPLAMPDDRSANNPTRLAWTDDRSAKSPVKVTMSYGRYAKNPIAMAVLRRWPSKCPTVS